MKYINDANNKKGFTLTPKFGVTLRSKGGFTLLLAMLISSIILSMSVGISVFIIRELLVSAMGRESQIAFFAADSGVECALYWDLKQNSFATSSTHVISCAGSSPIVGGVSGISNFDLTFTNGACVHVKVDKTVTLSTTIDSAGHNTCNLNDPNRVERTLRVRY